MKLYKQILFSILIIFFKTETVFSENNLFNVNNIKLEKKDKTANSTLADQAFKKGFDQLTKKILLKEDINIISNLSISTIKQLVTYYQISNISDKENEEEFVNFSITFDKEKIHDLFYKKGISYSEILDKEIYVLPVFINGNEVLVFNNNFFYKNWNKVNENELIEFILPLENIEIIQNINTYKNNLINVNITNLFEGYPNKNLAFILIEDNKADNSKVYIKARIQEKNISKSLVIQKQKKQKNIHYENIIFETNNELIDLIKSRNLIDIRTPSFLNAKFNINKKDNLVELNSRIKNIDAIENIFVQEFNKDFMHIRIKYLGKLDKIITLLKRKNIDLQLINDQWIIKTL